MSKIDKTHARSMSHRLVSVTNFHLRRRIVTLSCDVNFHDCFLYSLCLFERPPLMKTLNCFEMQISLHFYQLANITFSIDRYEIYMFANRLQSFHIDAYRYNISI